MSAPQNNGPALKQLAGWNAGWNTARVLRSSICKHWPRLAQQLTFILTILTFFIYLVFSHNMMKICDISSPVLLLSSDQQSNVKWWARVLSSNRIASFSNEKVGSLYGVCYPVILTASLPSPSWHLYVQLNSNALDSNIMFVLLWVCFCCKTNYSNAQWRKAWLKDYGGGLELVHWWKKSVVCF